MTVSFEHLFQPFSIPFESLFLRVLPIRNGPLSEGLGIDNRLLWTRDRDIDKFQLVALPFRHIS
jgi:hypothetical protein